MRKCSVSMALLAAACAAAPMYATTRVSTDSVAHVFVFLQPNAALSLSQAQEREVAQGHMANIRRLSGLGTLIFAGPTGDGGGVFMLRAESAVSASDMLQADPAIAGGILLTDAFPVAMASGRACQPSEPLTMKRRNFLSGRFNQLRQVALLRAGLQLSNYDLMLVDRASQRLVVVFDGEANGARSSRAQQIADRVGVRIDMNAEVFLPRGALCEPLNP